jgi:hypothetical protein
VANFLDGITYPGDFSEEVYITWLKRIESLSYLFRTDLRTIQEYLEENSKNFQDIFVSSGQHPVFLKMLLRRQISLETAVILNKIEPYLPAFDSQIKENLIWPMWHLKILKYSPFLQIDQENFQKIKETL